MKPFKRYLIPSLIAVLLLACLIVSGYVHTQNLGKTKKPDEAELIQLPHGRVLYAVIEENGIYIGQEFVSFLLFPKFLEENRMKLQPDYALILGTESTKYGHVAEAFASIKGVLKIPATIVTIPTANGTRRGPIEVHKHFWDY
jgi:hypothetical protein